MSSACTRRRRPVPFSVSAHRLPASAWTRRAFLLKSPSAPDCPSAGCGLYFWRGKRFGQRESARRDRHVASPHGRRPDVQSGRVVQRGPQGAQRRLGFAGSTAAPARWPARRHGAPQLGPQAPRKFRRPQPLPARRRPGGRDEETRSLSVVGCGTPSSFGFRPASFSNVPTRAWCPSPGTGPSSGWRSACVARRSSRAHISHRRAPAVPRLGRFRGTSVVTSTSAVQPSRCCVAVCTRVLTVSPVGSSPVEPNNGLPGWSLQDSGANVLLAAMIMC